MFRTVRSSYTYMAILIAVVIVIAAYVATVLIPRCSILMQKLSGLAATVTHDSSLASAAQCTETSNGQVYFVSCGGFF